MTDHSPEQPIRMSAEETAPPIASDSPAPPRPGSPPPRHAIGLMGPLVAAGFTLVVVGGLWLWQQQRLLAARIVVDAAPIVSVDPARVATLETQLADLARQLKQMERQPAAPADLGPVQARLDQLSARLDARQGEDGAADQASEAKLQAMDAKLAAMEQRLAAAEQHEQAALARATRAAALTGAAQALAAGRPLGDIPGAPPALARFAAAAPPTEAALRLAFPAAASAAARASLPAAGQSFGQRMLQRAEGLVTIRQGEEVLVGAPATQVLAEARVRLDAGDLAGTLATLNRLDPAAAAALAGWRAQAQALLDARAALAAMAQS